MIRANGLDQRRSNLVLFTVIVLEGLPFFPLPQDGELFVSPYPAAEAEWVSIGIGCR